MALLHRATVSPSKLELLTDWLPGRSWFPAGLPLERVGSFRFDDPAGQVGVETLLVAAGDGTLLQVPLTYRNAPVDGLERHLVGTAEHSVLGRRWVYDGCADPVWAATLATAVLTGGTQAEELVDTGDGAPAPRDPDVTVRGSGSAGAPVAEVGVPAADDQGPITVVRVAGWELVLARVVGTELTAAHTLTGWWAGGGPVVLAGVTPIG